MDEGMNYPTYAEMMFNKLREIAEIAEDHIDYNTDGWHRVLKLARQALGDERWMRA